MLTVWGRKTSSNVQALMWCIGEMQLPYIRHDVGHKYKGTDTDFFYSLNPNRTVPVLQDGSSPLCGRREPFYAIWLIVMDQKLFGHTMRRKRQTLTDGLSGQKLTSRWRLLHLCSGE